MNTPPLKLKWKIAAPPTGKYRSFDKRSWPSANHENGRPAVMISCDDSYVPANVKTGSHGPLAVRIADWSMPTDPEAARWQWRKLKGTFATLDEAKRAAQAVLAKHPEFWPGDEQ